LDKGIEWCLANDLNDFYGRSKITLNGDEMALFKNKYRIQSTRLRDWDYSNAGLYFVTIVTKNRVCYFGNIENGDMHLNELGKIAKQCFEKIPEHFPFVMLDVFVIMPNHVHGIIIIDDRVKTKNGSPVVETQDLASPPPKPPKPPKPPTSPTSKFPPLPTFLQTAANQFGPQSRNLASIVRGYKIGVTKYARKNNIPFQWQSRYYDNIIGNEKSLDHIRQYIIQNPMNWDTDTENPVLNTNL
jgi:REP element-mobilizing transposase RayT